MVIRHKTKGATVGGGTIKKIPDPVPVVTKWFIVRKEDHTRYDGREFSDIDEAFKAQDALGDDKKRTYIDSVNTHIGKDK